MSYMIDKALLWRGVVAHQTLEFSSCCRALPTRHKSPRIISILWCCKPFLILECHPILEHLLSPSSCLSHAQILWTQSNCLRKLEQWLVPVTSLEQPAQILPLENAILICLELYRPWRVRCYLIVLFLFSKKPFRLNIYWWSELIQRRRKDSQFTNHNCTSFIKKI